MLTIYVSLCIYIIKSCWEPALNFRGFMLQSYFLSPISLNSRSILYISVSNTPWPSPQFARFHEHSSSTSSSYSALAVSDLYWYKHDKVYLHNNFLLYFIARGRNRIYILYFYSIHSSLLLGSYFFMITAETFQDA